MSEHLCGRCGATLPTEPPREGIRYRLLLRREVKTTSHVLTFQRWRFRWLPEKPADRARMFYTDLSLCNSCAGAVFLFAQGKEPADDREAGAPRG